MSARLKHTDDDGDLSVFVSGNQVLFACNHGHAWTARLAVEPRRLPRHTSRDRGGGAGRHHQRRGLSPQPARKENPAAPGAAFPAKSMRSGVAHPYAHPS